MSVHSRNRRASGRQEFDRNAWADALVVVTTFDTTGFGEAQSGLIDFGTVFENPPFFSYGVELQEGGTLVDGDFPFVTAGVSEWATMDADDQVGVQYYTGANVWVRIASITEYPLRFRFTFEGTAMRNVEHFRG